MASRKQNRIDWTTAITWLVLCLIGWITIYSAAYNADYDSIFSFNMSYGKQFIWICVSALLGGVILLTDSTLIRNKHYQYYPAKIINNSVSKRNNFITLNKGSKHGIKIGMGVITNQGAIGIIYSVSQQYAIAMSLLHRKSAIAIQLKKKNDHHNGILKWKGFDYKSASINDFPNHIPIVIGDTIITNGYSAIFPEGVLIGTVKNILKNKYDGYFDVSVSLFEDFNQLNYVYIIHSDEASEQEKLEQKIPADE